MATYKIEHACGHTERHELFGSRRLRESRESWLEGTLCRGCFIEGIREKRSAEALQAVEHASELGLPPLTGSAKQVAWAETIRAELISLHMEAEGAMLRLMGSITRFDPVLAAEGREWLRANGGEEATYATHGPAMIEAFETLVYEFIGQQSDARWWIDNRDCAVGAMARALQKRGWEIIKTIISGQDVREVERQKAVERAELEALARASQEEQARQKALEDAAATVIPENAITPLAAWFRYSDGLLAVIFPEPNPTVNHVLKTLRYHWSTERRRWERRVPETDWQDRLVEVAHRLLLVRVPILIKDPERRARALAGDYQPECLLWVATTIIGSTTWFCLQWPRESDLYSLAKRLPGARYQKPWVIVPGQAFVEVEDFAESHGFRFTASAQKLMETMRDARASELPVAPAPPPEAPVVNYGRPVLEVPTEVSIPEHLREES
jgi:hypothetical protein